MLTEIDTNKALFENSFVSSMLYHALSKAITIAGKGKYLSVEAAIESVAASKHFTTASEKANAKVVVTAAAASGTAKKDKAAKKAAAPTGPAYVANFDDIVVPVLPDTDWASAGLVRQYALLKGVVLFVLTICHCCRYRR